MRKIILFFLMLLFCTSVYSFEVNYDKTKTLDFTDITAPIFDKQVSGKYTVHFSIDFSLPTTTNEFLLTVTKDGKILDCHDSVWEYRAVLETDKKDGSFIEVDKKLSCFTQSEGFFDWSANLVDVITIKPISFDKGTKILKFTVALKTTIAVPSYFFSSNQELESTINGIKEIINENNSAFDYDKTGLYFQNFYPNPFFFNNDRTLNKDNQIYFYFFVPRSLPSYDLKIYFEGTDDYLLEKTIKERGNVRFILTEEEISKIINSPSYSETKNIRVNVSAKNYNSIQSPPFKIKSSVSSSSTKGRIELNARDLPRSLLVEVIGEGYNTGDIPSATVKFYLSSDTTETSLPVTRLGPDIIVDDVETEKEYVLEINLSNDAKSHTVKLVVKNFKSADSFEYGTYKIIDNSGVVFIPPSSPSTSGASVTEPETTSDLASYQAEFARLEAAGFEKSEELATYGSYYGFTKTFPYLGGLKFGYRFIKNGSLFSKDVFYNPNTEKKMFDDCTTIRIEKWEEINSDVTSEFSTGDGGFRIQVNIQAGKNEPLYTDFVSVIGDDEKMQQLIRERIIAKCQAIVDGDITTEDPTPADPTTEDPTETTALDVYKPTLITQTEKPIVEEIKYGEEIVLTKVPGSTDGSYSLKNVEINPSKGTLNIEFTPSDNATYYSAEIWGLNETEKIEFKNLVDGAGAIAWKDGEREKQFILKQDSFKLASGKTSFLIPPINLVSLFDKSNSTWHPKRDVQRCKDKYVWVNSSVNETRKNTICQDTGDNLDTIWTSFMFQKFYDYIKSQKRDFYLVIETSAKPTDSSKWKDSVLIPLNIAEPTPVVVPPVASPVVTGLCTDIAECKAMLDLKFIKEVFEKKNLIDFDSSKYKVVVDAGHGGYDSGAVYSGTTEKELNLEVAMLMADQFRQQGFLVELTRTKDETVEIPGRVNKAIAFYNSVPIVPRENRFFISVHHNATASDSCPNAAWVLHRNDNETSIAFANALNTALEGQGIADDYRVCSEEDCSNYDTLGVLRDTANSFEGTDNVALVEYNFMCSNNYGLITSSSWQQNAANGTVQGLVQYANVSSTVSGWHENIYATIHNFPDGSNASGLSCGAYCVALPERTALKKNIEVCNTRGSICRTVPVIDLGPFCISDSDYVFGSSRPYAELNKGTVFSRNEGPSCNPSGIRTYPASNGAGIDLNPALASYLGVPGNGYVKWRFI